MFKILMLTSALVITSCDSDGLKQEDFAEWKDHNISSYSFNYKTTGFAVSFQGANDGTLSIQVHNNEVIHTQFTTDDNIEEDKAIDFAPTIDDLIMRINNCEVSQSCEVSILELDEMYSFPANVTFSYGEESDGFIVSEFEVQ